MAGLLAGMRLKSGHEYASAWFLTWCALWWAVVLTVPVESFALEGPEHLILAAGGSELAVAVAAGLVAVLELLLLTELLRSHAVHRLARIVLTVWWSSVAGALLLQVPQNVNGGVYLGLAGLEGYLYVRTRTPPLDRPRRQ